MNSNNYFGGLNEKSRKIVKEKDIRKRKPKNPS
jgi:hypothetical protein